MALGVQARPARPDAGPAGRVAGSGVSRRARPADAAARSRHPPRRRGPAGAKPANRIQRRFRPGGRADRSVAAAASGTNTAGATAGAKLAARSAAPAKPRTSCRPPAPPAATQRNAPDDATAKDEPVWRSSLPLASPVVDAEPRLHAGWASVWKDDRGRQYLLLDKDVSIAIGVYGFRADRAVVRIDTEATAGKTIYHLAIYLDHAAALAGQGAAHAEADRLLVTASTTGVPGLETNLKQDVWRGDDPLVKEADARYRRHLEAIARRPLDVPPGGPLISRDAIARRDAIHQQILHDDQQYAVEIPPAGQPARPPGPATGPSPATPANPGTPGQNPVAHTGPAATRPARPPGDAAAGRRLRPPHQGQRLLSRRPHHRA